MMKFSRTVRQESFNLAATTKKTTNYMTSFVNCFRPVKKYTFAFCRKQDKVMC